MVAVASLVVGGFVLLGIGLIYAVVTADSGAGTGAEAGSSAAASPDGRGRDRNDGDDVGPGTVDRDGPSASTDGSSGKDTGAVKGSTPGRGATGDPSDDGGLGISSTVVSNDGTSGGASTTPTADEGPTDGATKDTGTAVAPHHREETCPDCGGAVEDLPRRCSACGTVVGSGVGLVLEMRGEFVEVDPRSSVGDRLRDALVDAGEDRFAARQISSSHLRFRPDGSAYEVRDESTHGTTLDGRALGDRWEPVRDGDTLLLADSYAVTVHLNH
jgi:hypothetical protein